MTGPDQFARQSDAELLQLAMAGQENAFRLLYERLKTGIFRYAFYATNSKSAAEEVTQEVFIALFREGHKYNPGLGDLAGFAFGMARNFIRRIERRERPYHTNDDDWKSEKLVDELGANAETLSGQMIRNELVARVQAAVASLPDHYRQVVVLCDLCELSYEEASGRLQCPMGTIRSRLNRAHALLAQKLKPLRNSQPEIEAAGPEGCIV